jgi:hypothetical protein
MVGWKLPPPVGKHFLARPSQLPSPPPQSVSLEQAGVRVRDRTAQVARAAGTARTRTIGHLERRGATTLAAAVASGAATVAGSKRALKNLQRVFRLD